MDMSQFDALLIGLTDYVASRPNCGHWKMTQKEVQSITEPLGNIIAKSDYINQISEHSDAIALVIACGTIFIPRIIISSNIQKEKKGTKIPVQVKKNDKEKEGHNSNSDRTAEGVTGHATESNRKLSGKSRADVTANAGQKLSDLAIGMF